MREARRDEIVITPEMIEPLFEVEMHTFDDPEKRLEDAASFFAAIFFSLPEAMRAGVTSIRTGAKVWTPPQGGL